MRGLRSMLVAVLAVVLAGCSFGLVDGPRDARKAPAPPCTHSYAAPLVDSALTLIALAVAVESYRDASDDNDLFGLGVATSGFAVLTLASGVYGFVQVSRCKRSEPPPPDDYIIKDRNGDGR